MTDIYERTAQQWAEYTKKYPVTFQFQLMDRLCTVVGHESQFRTTFVLVAQPSHFQQLSFTWHDFLRLMGDKDD